MRQPEIKINAILARARKKAAGWALFLSGRILAAIIILSFTACGHKAAVTPPSVKQMPADSMPDRPEEAASASPSRSIEPPKSVAPGLDLTSPKPSSIPDTQSTVLPASPHIRIGIRTSAREVRVSASGGYYLIEKTAEAPRRLVQGQIQVRLEHGDSEPSAVFRVQVAALSRAEGAEELRLALSGTLSVPVMIDENTRAGLYRVRVGAFGSREEAQRFAAGRLAEAGYTDSLIVRDTAAEMGREPTLALRGSDNLFIVNRTGYLFSPVSGAPFLYVDGKPYRGVIDLSIGKSGLMTVVNELGIEEYLLGVVPAEMSPTTYPEAASLAAQAIAARTYALKNMGRFRSEGFDLTDDNRTQVYGGVAVEKEASTDAVRRTFGVAMYYENKLIDAMYFSTCGGRTEDFSEVFDAPDVPYLKSVVCAVESGSDDFRQTTLAGEREIPGAIFSADGRLANRALALATVLGLTESDRLSEAYLSEPAKRDEIRKWLEQTRRVIQKTSIKEPDRNDDITSRAGFIRFVAESIFGSLEIETRISASDAAYYLRNLKDGSDVPQPAQRAVAFLIQQGLWEAYPDNCLRPNMSISRADALTVLVNCIESSRPDILSSGIFPGPTTDAPQSNPEHDLLVRTGNLTQQFHLAKQLRLFRLSGGRYVQADSLQIIGNEKLRFHANAERQIDFLEVELNPTGAASDRYSPVATWDVSFSTQEIAQKLAGLMANLGEIRDLKPARLGKSGRAVKMEIIGSRGSTVVNGLSFRSALGLKDTLFTIHRHKSADGRIDSFDFQGRGWGHGVGLCQVGAYGMARAGRSADEILKTYYRGIEIRKAY